MKWNVLFDGTCRQYELVNVDNYYEDIKDDDLVTENPYAPTAEGIKKDISLIRHVNWGKSTSCLVVKRVDWGDIGICTLIESLDDYATAPIYWRLMNPITKIKKRLPLNANFSQPLPLP